MSHEQATQSMETAWHVFELWTGTRDETSFRRSYLGHYPNRDAFGQELLSRLGADGRISRLPAWLQAYIKFDGEAVVRDFEQAGHFFIYDAPEAAGTFVFDAYEQPESQPSALHQEAL